MARVWQIKAQTGESPVGEAYYTKYIFIDTTDDNDFVHVRGSKRRVELMWRHQYEKDMFEGTKLEVTYLHEDDEIEVTAKQLAMVAGRSQFFTLK